RAAPGGAGPARRRPRPGATLPRHRPAVHGDGRRLVGLEEPDRPGGPAGRCRAGDALSLSSCLFPPAHLSANLVANFASRGPHPPPPAQAGEGAGGGCRDRGGKITGRNPARERLVKGELSLGIGLRQARTVDTAAIMATCGFDWLFIDLEHGTMPLDTAVQIS